MKRLRIGCGEGFYGDALWPAPEVAQRGDAGYIAFDCLSELTMAILQKDRQRDPALGYTRDVGPMLRGLLPIAREKGIRLITNAGGINPAGAAAVVLEVARELGIAGLKVAVVSGDSVLHRLDELAALPTLEAGEPLGRLRERLLFANVYLGAQPIVRALQLGADVVVTGRVTDTALWLAPCIHELGWAADDWDRLAAGVITGHLLECSGQVTAVVRYDLPNLHAFNFIRYGALDGGGARSLRSDNLGKCFAAHLLRLELEV